VSFITQNEVKLREHFELLRSDIPDTEKDSLNTAITGIFSSILIRPESFFYPWHELDMIGKIKTNDMQLNLFTWHMEKSNNIYEYYGILQYRIPGKKKKDKIMVFPLADKSVSLKNPEKPVLTPDNWYGSLYYSVSAFTHRKKTWYALLGFDFNDAFSHKKCIEILHFENNKPVFGGEIKLEKDEVARLIFEYSSNVVMSLRYDDKVQKVVFDHLVPLEPIFKGFYRFYVPDGSYDALTFSNGTFTLEKDVDARNY
jgi:hypothetical protein